MTVIDDYLALLTSNERKLVIRDLEYQRRMTQIADQQRESQRLLCDYFEHPTSWQTPTDYARREQQRDAVIEAARALVNGSRIDTTTWEYTGVRSLALDDLTAAINNLDATQPLPRPSRVLGPLSASRGHYRFLRQSLHNRTRDLARTWNVTPHAAHVRSIHGSMLTSPPPRDRRP